MCGRTASRLTSNASHANVVAATVMAAIAANVAKANHKVSVLMAARHRLTTPRKVTILSQISLQCANSPPRPLLNL